MYTQCYTHPNNDQTEEHNKDAPFLICPARCMSDTSVDKVINYES